MLRRYLGEKFEAYLREGWLEIAIVSGVASFLVLPPRLRLPRLMTAFRVVRLPDDPSKQFKLDLYFDASGKGRVAIRHRGVTVVEDLAAVNSYGLEQSSYCGGFVRGHIDADFLTPLPARTSFEQDDEWIGLLDALDRHRSTLDAELEGHLAEHRAKQASDIERRALRIARDILDLEEFRDLALPGGLAKRGRPAPAADMGRTAGAKKTMKSRRRPTDPGDKTSPRGQRIGYRELPFENGSRAHSRFVSGVVQANTLHPDYMAAARAPESRLAYAALLIGKETIAFNDRSGLVGDFLEKLLDFYFTLHKRRPWRGRRPKQPKGGDEDQAALDLA
jgi:hypothetical protein